MTNGDKDCKIIISFLFLVFTTKSYSQKCNKIDLTKIISLANESYSQFDDFAISNCYKFDNIITDQNHLTRRRYIFEGSQGENPEIFVYETGEVYGENKDRCRLIISTDSLEIYTRFKKALKQNGFVFEREEVFNTDQLIFYKSKTHSLSIVISSGSNFYKFQFRIEKIIQKMKS